MAVLKLVVYQIISCFCMTSMLVAVQTNGNIEQQIIPNPNKSEEKIEFFILKPAHEGPFPVIFLLHGYQPPENSNGGKQLVEFGYLQRFSNQGVVAISISMPGYGNSTGKRDFGGPHSQQAVIAVINHIKNLPFVDPSRIGIYGVSRGAQLAGMVSSHYPKMSFQILESGFYDLVSFQSNTPDYLGEIKNSIFQEGGDTLEALIERSPVYHINDLKTPTLILQGEFDDRRQLPAAKKLNQELIKKGIDSILKVYQNEVHDLPLDKWDTIIPFIRERFFGLYGIGIKVSLATPAMQIVKIHPNSPASKLKNLKVGDAILSISPTNDQTEIPVLRMPTNTFMSLVLGNKGSSLRIRVQHFDLSIEDIVIERG